MDRCVILSQFALDLCKKRTDDLSGIKQYITNDNGEESYVSVCNVMFSYYKNQYGIASTDEQREYVVSLMLNMYDDLFCGKYLSHDTISVIFLMACNMGNPNIIKNCVEQICGMDNIEGYRTTCNYVYRYCANYIVDTNIFYKEPYTTILDHMLTYITNEDPVIKMPPDYFS